MTLTESGVELILRQVLVVVNIVVLQQVEQRALRCWVSQTFLFDDLKERNMQRSLTLVQNLSCIRYKDEPPAALIINSIQGDVVYASIM